MINLFIILSINICVYAQQSCIFSDNRGDYFFDLSSLNQDNLLKINETSSFIFNLCSPLMFHYQTLGQKATRKLARSNDRAIQSGAQLTFEKNSNKNQTFTLKNTNSSNNQLKKINNWQSHTKTYFNNSVNPSYHKPATIAVNQKFKSTKSNKLEWNKRQLDNSLMIQNYSNMIIWEPSNNSYAEINRYQKNLYLSLQLVRKNKPLQGLVLLMKDSTLNTDITFYLNCDKSTNLILVNFFDYGRQRKYIISVRSSAACPIIVTSKLWVFFNDLSEMFGIILLVFGGFQVFLGYKLMKITFFTVGYMIGFCLLTVQLGIVVLNQDSDVSVVVSLFVITSAFSLLIGYICVVQPVFGFFCIGAGFGIVLTLIFQNCFLVYIQSEPEILPLLITMLILVFVFGVLSRKFPEHITITSSSLMGSYCMVRPLSWQGSDFPNELTVSQSMKYGFINSMPINYYFYLLAIIILSVLGITIQYSLYFKKQQIEDLFEPSYYGGYVEMDSFRQDGRNKTMMFNEYGLEEYPQTIQSFRGRENGMRRPSKRLQTSFLRQLNRSPTELRSGGIKSKVKFQHLPEDEELETQDQNLRQRQFNNVSFSEHLIKSNSQSPDRNI